jgi:hypothetical protein
MNWFTSLYTNQQLAQIISDYSKDCTGYREYVSGGRCTLVRKLEQLDAYCESQK